MANWIIDRTINLDEFKTRNVLNELLIAPRKSDSELEHILHEKGVLKNEGDGALRRRWYTYLRNYGLMSGDDVTEMGVLYAESKLSLQELSLLQLIKKRIKLSNNTYIYPLKVLVGLLILLKNSGNDEAYITREEFTNYVVNIPSDSDTDIQSLANTIITARTNNYYATNIEGQHDDIWFNSLNQTKIFEYFGRSLFVSNFEILNLLDIYYKNHLILPINYGTFAFGFTDNIALPTKSNGSFNLSYVNAEKNSGSILLEFFFKKTSINRIEEKFYGNKKHYIGVKTLIEKLNLDLSNIGMYSDFASYRNIVLIRMINSGDNELMEVAKLMQNSMSVDIIENVEADSSDDSDDIFNIIKEKYENKDFEYVDVKPLYDDFKELYGKETLKSLNGKPLLYRLFALKKMDNNSMIYRLEHDSTYKYFGGIGGGSSFKFSLYYSDEKQSWVKGTHSSNLQLISEEDAIAFAEDNGYLICGHGEVKIFENLHTFALV